MPRKDNNAPPREFPRTFESIKTRNDVFSGLYESGDREFHKSNDEVFGQGGGEYGNANALYGPNSVGGNNFQYPGDLGSVEYNHFVLFSIYQGSSLNIDKITAADNGDESDGNSYMNSAGGSSQASSNSHGNANDAVMEAENRRINNGDMARDRSRDSRGQDTTTLRTGGMGSGRGQANRSSGIQQTRINPAKVRMMESVALYMPQKINQLGILDYDLEGTAGAAMVKDLANADMRAVAALGKGAMNAVTKTADAVASMFGVDDTGFDPAMRATMRITSNPRRELVFNQPQPRKFEFNFEFAPRNSDESKTALEIIRTFKFHAYPYLQQNGYFYEMPAEFHVKYFMTDDTGAVAENTWLNRIGACALTEVNVDYAASGVASFHQDGSPTHINLSLTFSEMEVMTQQHVSEGF
jgi:hypothetical protein